MADPCFVGLDVSKARLDVHVLPAGTAFAVANDPAGIADLVARLTALAPAAVVLEATGGLAAAAAALAGAGLPVSLVNPRPARDFAKGFGRLAKTDAVDAATLALFADTVRPQPRPLPDETAAAFTALLVRRRQLLDMRVAEQNRLPAARTAAVRRDIQRHLDWLARQLGRLEADLAAAVQASPVWRAKEDLLRTAPGVGPTVARTLLAELPELGTLSGKQAAALTAWPRSPGTAARGAGSGRSAAAGRRCGRPCTWPPCRPPGTTRRCAPSGSGCGRPARRPRWPWWRSPASSWSSSTPCPATAAPGPPNSGKPLNNQHSRSGARNNIGR
jgi:transposase